MRDTSLEVDGAFTAMFAARSGSDRVKMACEMFDLAKALATADIRAQHPGILAADLRERLFDRLYFGDFDEAARARIVAALRLVPLPHTT